MILEVRFVGATVLNFQKSPQERILHHVYRDC